MRLGTIAFLLGIFAVQQLADLPDIRWAGLIPLCLIVLIFLPGYWKLPIILVTGALWALLLASWQLDGRLPAELEGTDLILEGDIVSIPKRSDRSLRFDFDTTIHSRAYLLRLNWYDLHSLTPHAGERWRLRVKLKRVHGFMNPGGFDYERSLFRQGISATGYVRRDDINEKIHAVTDEHIITHWRETITTRIADMLGPESRGGLIRALAVGDRQGISSADWQVLTRTGTSHLVAISGLHIGLVAGFVFFLIRFLCRRFTRLLLLVPADIPAAMFAILFAVAYALLAGFSVPTQRALIMVCVVMLGVMTRRRFAPSSVLSLALLCVLIYDPLSVLEAGFWLSFTAVGIIIFTLSGRLQPASKLRVWSRIQWLIAIGMFPVTLILFQRVSLIAPIANLVAVPWVSFVSVPLTLVGTIMLPVSEYLSQLLLQSAAWSLDILWALIEPVSMSDFATWQSAAPLVWTLVPAIFGAVWCLMPAGWPARWLGIIYVLPMLLLSQPGPGQDELWLTVLDVGQGLAVVVESGERVLIYDTGTRFSNHFDAGSAVLLPFLRARGIDEIDTLIISHGDNDHRGGADSLLAGIKVKTILTGARPERWTHPRARYCQAGQQWQWGDVQFSILNPLTQTQRPNNNRSCVLKIQLGEQSVLLTGDIEAKVEKVLVEQQAQDLRANILVVPHHGSRTSSTQGFLEAIKPDYGLLSVGYRNRYRFPHPTVEKRYQQNGVELLDTASNGAIHFTITRQGISRPEKWRHSARRYWHFQ